MNSDRCKQNNTLVQAALEREPFNRSAFIKAACEYDEALRREVEEHLVSVQAAGSFLERSGFEHRS
jgi:hypothetical protein